MSQALARKTRANAPVTVAERIRTAAFSAWELGICVIPIKADGSKVPPLKWQEFIHRRPTRRQMDRFFVTYDQQGMALLCGGVSKGLECLDFDSDEAYEAFRSRARECGLFDLLESTENAYLEKTPRGVHLFYYCDTPRASTVLARQTAAGGTRKAVIETRGQGAYAIVSPSCGGVHESGKPYRRISGTFATIPTISAEEREDLIDLARSFDESLPSAKSLEGPTLRRSEPSVLLPGDDFNARADWGPDILEPAGWHLVLSNGDTHYWRRPGKARGVSATTAYGWGDYLYVFSTSTTLQARRAFDKFGAYARLHHAGDMAAATRALAARGYGSGNRAGFIGQKGRAA